MPVRSYDGKLVGTVAALARDCFLLRRRFGRECWLSDMLIRERRGDEVVLHSTSRDLRRHGRASAADFAPLAGSAPRFEFRQSTPRSRPTHVFGTVVGAVLVATGLIAAITVVAI